MLILEAFDTTTTVTVDIQGTEVDVTYDSKAVEAQMVRALKMQKKAKKTKEPDPLESIEFLRDFLTGVVKSWDIQATADGDRLPVSEATCELLGLKLCGLIAEAIQEDFNGAPKD